MSQFKLFMKENKTKKENAKYVATVSLKDEKGNPLEWEIRPLTTKENEKLRESCIKTSSSKKRGNADVSFNSTLYLAKMVATSVVYPNLSEAQLQDSYGVMTPEDLLKELVDNPAEYQDLIDFVSDFNGYEKTLEEKIEEAKK